MDTNKLYNGILSTSDKRSISICQVQLARHTRLEASSWRLGRSLDHPELDQLPDDANPVQHPVRIEGRTLYPKLFRGDNDKTIGLDGNINDFAVLGDLSIYINVS
jgi:hypothetical protein